MQGLQLAVPNHRSDDWKCGLCKNTFQVPKQLPCAHTFCLVCLQQRAQQANLLAPVCPACRKPFHVPSGGMNELPTNIYAECMLEYEAVFNSANINNAGNNAMEVSNNDERRPVLAGFRNECDICKASASTMVGSTDVASTFCRDCNQNFCAKCLNIHTLMSVSEPHKLVQILKKDDVNSLRCSYERKCDMHSTEQERFYCFKCGIPLCEQCRIAGHSDHIVSEVKEASASLRIQLLTTSLNIKDRLNRVDVELDRQKVITETHLELVHRQKPSVVRLVEEENWLRIVETLQPNEVDVCMAYKTHHETEKLLKTMKELLENLLNKMDALRMHASPCEIMCTAKDYLKNAEQALNWMDTTAGTKKDTVEFKDYMLATSAFKENLQSWKVHLCSISKPLSFITIPFAPKWAPRETRVVAHADTIYGIGLGQNNNEMWSWTSVPGEWSRRANMPLGRTAATVIRVNDVIYVLGGSKQAAGHAEYEVQSYNTQTSAWSINGSLTRAVLNAACIERDGVIYLFGGSTLSSTLHPYIQAYDTRTHECRMIAENIPYKERLNAIRYNNYVIFIGYGECFLFDLNNMMWSSRSAFKCNMKVFSVALVDDAKGARLYVAGGRSDGETAWQHFDVRYVMVDKLIIDDIPATWVSNITYQSTTEFQNEMTYTATCSGVIRFCKP